MTETRSKDVAKWQETATKDRETSHRGYYIPMTKESIGLILGSAPKKYVSRYYQLKVGLGGVGIFLARIWVIETPEC